jgi:hypothetical protein
MGRCLARIFGSAVRPEERISGISPRPRFSASFNTGSGMAPVQTRLRDGSGPRGSCSGPCRSAFNPTEDRYLLGMFGPAVTMIGNQLLVRSRHMVWAAFLTVTAALCSMPASPAGALDLFATHEVTAQFATPDGKPMSNAEVRVFAPDDPSKVALTGRTDAEGKFVFDADRDGFWSAEARSADYVARVMIRVGGEAEPHNRLSPFLLIGLLVVLLGLAIWYRLLRVRTRGPRT